jgi:hypothetical protein
MLSVLFLEPHDLLSEPIRELLLAASFVLSVATNALEHGTMLYAKKNEDAHPVFRKLDLHLIDLVQEWVYTLPLFLSGLSLAAAFGLALMVRPLFQGILNLSLIGRVIDPDEPDWFPVRWKGTVLFQLPKLFAGRRRPLQGVLGGVILSATLAASALL